MLRLSPPKHVTFFISIAVAIIAVIIHYAKIDIPHVHSGLVILLIGYLVLVAGNAQASRNIVAARFQLVMNCIDWWLTTDRLVSERMAYFCDK
jgi:hypothetical protein